MNLETSKQKSEKKKKAGGEYYCSICGIIIAKDALTYWQGQDVYCGPICSLKGCNQKYKENDQWE